MQPPPFRLARAPSPHLQDVVESRPARLADACCAPSPADLRAARRRTRLVELDSHLHCSVIGTCLSTSELRKLVPRYAGLDREEASDLQIHHAAVELAIEGGAGCKAMQKALDERYGAAVRRFDKAGDPEAVLTLWNEFRRAGDIPAGYWAVMTHPQATLEVRQAAFGEVHMLSHLVGAANRADLRRLVALEEENAGLREKIERQQLRLQALSVQREQAVRRANEQSLEWAAHSESRPDTHLVELKAALAERDARVALQTSRREAAEQRAHEEQAHSIALGKRLEDVLEALRVAQAECGALEQALLDPAETAGQTRPELANLAGKRVVYVGGRPGSNAVLRRLVEAAGGEFVVHDGGIEDRKGMFAAALPGADVVVFPVDCIDHDSMNLLKRVCTRHQVDYFPVRTASVASFMELMSRLGNARLSNPSSAPRFCLRHG